MSATGTANRRRNARNAPPCGARNATAVSQSRLKVTMRSGTAGTADGRVLSEKARAFAASRHLSAATLAKLNVASGTAFFPELDRKAEAIVFPYGKGWKARAIEEKAFVASKGWKVSFWNLDR